MLHYSHYHNLCSVSFLAILNKTGMQNKPKDVCTLLCALAGFVRRLFLILVLFVCCFHYVLTRCRQSDDIAFWLHRWSFAPRHRIVPLAYFFLLFFVSAVLKINIYVPYD